MKMDTVKLLNGSHRNKDTINSREDENIIQLKRFTWEVERAQYFMQITDKSLGNFRDIEIWHGHQKEQPSLFFGLNGNV